MLLNERMGRVTVHLLAAAARHSGIGHVLAQGQVERAHHAVRGVEPAEGLQDDLVHGAAGLAVYRRAGDALAGQDEAAGQQHRHGGAVMQPKDHRVLGDSVHLEERSNRAEQIDHLEHQRHVTRQLDPRDVSVSVKPREGRIRYARTFLQALSNKS